MCTCSMPRRKQAWGICQPQARGYQSGQSYAPCAPTWGKTQLCRHRSLSTSYVVVFLCERVCMCVRVALGNVLSGLKVLLLLVCRRRRVVGMLYATYTYMLRCVLRSVPSVVSRHSSSLGYDEVRPYIVVRVHCVYIGTGVAD